MIEGADTRDATALVGRRLGEFVVREVLSSGGFGTVYRAEQQALAREAVVKVMHTRLRASEAMIQRFLREAKLASRLDHPYAAHLYAFGAEPDGLLWIAMELVRGTPLDRLLESQGPVPLERFVPLLERICQVVQTAHDQGIVHRDLKPANVMVLARAGQLLPKLLDLGIAKISDDDLAPPPSPRTTAELAETALAGGAGALAETMTPTPNPDSSGRLTEEGAIMGSPLYMAPEQWMDAATVDMRTDLYALGVLSYEALTGKAPFTGANRMQIAMAHAHKDAPKLGGNFPPALDDVLARALAKRPEDRYGSALELAAAFRAASGLTEEPVALPRLAEDVRVAVTARAPQPIAQAASALEAARNPHQARDAIWQLVRVSVRYVAVVALAAHAQVGGRRGDGKATDAVRRLRRRALPDAEWLAIARELVQPFAKLRDAHPVPELVDLFAGSASAPITELLALRDNADGGASDDAVRELLATALPFVERMLGALAFLAEYRLVVPTATGAQLWMGLRRNDPPYATLRGRTLTAGQPALVDASGLPVVALWPFVQVYEPARGVGPRLVFLEGAGRRGARLVALPEPFEHQDDVLWEAIGALAEDKSDDTSSQELSPFPGLAAFTAADADRFFGRERETEELVNRLRAQPLLAVVGASGAGKSSVVQAGMLPNLPDDWESIVLRPGAAPLATLASRVAKLGITGEPERLGEQLRARGRTVVIVVDQLEELFTLCQDAGERARFVDALASAARTVDDPVRVVMTLRDDFLLQAEALPALRSRLAQSLHLLVTPSRDDLLRILNEPLHRAGYEFDDAALPGDMVDALAGTRGALALLSFTASKLWELRDRRFRQLSRKAYTSLGGIGGALARHAEATLDAMLPDEQRLVREVFRHAVTAEGTRAVLSRAELEQLLGGSRHGPAVIEKLVAARLLVASEGATGGEHIEITHEALIEAWPRLVAWRSEDAEGTRLRDQLRTAARQWQERGRPSGLLWRGDALAEYRQWRARYPGTLTDLETAFAEQSLGDAARAQRRRRLLLAGAFGVLSVGLIALSVLNRQVSEERATAEQTSQQLDENLRESYEGQARQYLQTGDYQRALAYLEEARKHGAHGPAHDLVAAFVARGLSGKVRTFAHDEGVLDVKFSPDGTKIVTASDDSHARVWSLADGKLVAEIVHGHHQVESATFVGNDAILTAGVDGIAVLWDAATGRQLATYDAHVAGNQLMMALASPDGTLVATVGADDGVRLWDRDGKLLHVLREPGKNTTQPLFPRACAFSPDGARIAAGDHDGMLRVWDTHAGTLTGSRRAHDKTINTVAFSRDGARIATASDDFTAIIWDAATVAPGVRVRHDGEVNAATFDPDGKVLATASNDHSAKLWDVATGTRLLSLDGHVAGINAIEFSPDGKQLATAADDANVIVWDPRNGRQQSRLAGHKKSIWVLHFARSGDRLVTGGGDGSAIVWNAEPQLPATGFVGHTQRVFTAELSPDLHVLATGGVDGTVRLWDRASGRQLRTQTLERNVVRAARFSPDGRRLAIGTDQEFLLWDLVSDRTIAHHPGATYDVEWSRDGTHVATANPDGAHICSSDGVIVSTFATASEVLSVSFARDGAKLVTTTRKRDTQLWDTATGKPIAQWNNGYFYARLDPRGELVAAAAGNEATIARLDDAEHRPIAQLQSVAPVFDVEWSAAGDFLVTASLDGTIRIWDRGGHPIATLHAGIEQMWRARFSADDRYVVSASTTGADAIVWEIPHIPAGFDQLVRCKDFRLEGDQLVLAKKPPGCT